jgi:hypothetical protein
MLLQDAKSGVYVAWDLSHHFSVDDINVDLLDKHYQQVVWVYTCSHGSLWEFIGRYANQVLPVFSTLLATRNKWQN